MAGIRVLANQKNAQENSQYIKKNPALHFAISRTLFIFLYFLDQHENNVGAIQATRIPLGYFPSKITVQPRVAPAT